MAEVTSQKEGSQKGTPVLTEAQQEKAEELAQAIELVKQHRRENRMSFFKPYPWQADFYKSGKTNKQRLLMAANRVGKTASMAGGVPSDR